MNLLRYFEVGEIKPARERTGDLVLLVELAKREERAAEERLRAKLVQSREALDRPPVAGALTGRRHDDV